MITELGLTVAYRGEMTLLRTLASLDRAGFGKPRLFCDGVVAAEIPAEYHITQRTPAIGGWPNFWLGLSELGIKTFDLLGTFAVPIDGMDHVITLTPFFRMDQLNANPGLDVPDALYEAGVKSFWKKVLNDRLTTMVVFTPSVRSDFHSSQGAFKLFGMAMLQWKLVPDKLSMTGGAIYTGRQDFPVLPTMGLLWTPSPLWKLDIQFPSPRFSRRLMKNGDQSETWGYLAGVFGGNTWAVRRGNGTDDQLTLRDLRLVLGVEHLLAENRGVFVETGWVFSRSMEFENTPVQIDLGDALLLRAGIQF